jgi:hypothetical protein
MPDITIVLGLHTSVLFFAKRRAIRLPAHKFHPKRDGNRKKPTIDVAKPLQI